MNPPRSAPTPAFPPVDFESLERCPLCAASRDAYRVLTRRGDRFGGERAVLCARCGLVFLDPRLRPEALARYYGSDTFSLEVRGTEGPSAEGLAYRDMRARRRWGLLRDSLPGAGSGTAGADGSGREAAGGEGGPRCLEIGCGAGNFLEVLRDAGYRATGIDPSRGFAEHARGRGMDVHVGHFPGDLPSGHSDVPNGPDGPPFRYDLVFMFHVLEHVPDPEAMLRDVRARVADGGLFVLEYPDIELAARRRFLPPTYFERQHLFDFSRATVGAFLARVGFRVRDTLIDGPEKPYDRNVLLVCEATEPADPDPARPDEAEALWRALRWRLRVSEPLLPLRPLVQAVKRRLGTYGGMR